MKTLVAISIVAALLLSGCGESSDSTSQSLTTLDITVERGPVLGATVSDAKGQVGESRGNGVYRFSNPSYPIESIGGYIDIDRDGNISAGDIAMNGLQMRTFSGDVITLATTIAQNSSTYSALLEDGFSKEALLAARPSTDRDIAALSDELYKYAIENNITDLAQLQESQVSAIRGRIQTRRSLYSSSPLDSATLEYNLVTQELNMESLLADINLTTEESIENIINRVVPLELTIEQKATLAYMWDEERLAHDLYLALNQLYPSQTLYSIATKGESQHIASIEGLIEKYDLNIFNSVDYSGGYSSDALSAYGAGSFALDEIQELYDSLYAEGSASFEDALGVGCIVEVTDIEDLDRDIVIAEGAQDLVALFESLRLGSYNHYWAFDRALKAQGIESGCCSLGEAYCKTSTEYPINERMGGRD